MIIRHKHVRLILFPFPDKPMQIRDVFDKNMEDIFYYAHAAGVTLK
jgi:hypothetical protein